jgi:hypothetical protein
MMNIAYYRLSGCCLLGILIGCILFSSSARANDGVFKNSLTGAGLTTGASLVVEDSEYNLMKNNPAWVSQFTNKAVDNYVKLSVDGVSTTSYQGEVLLNISYHVYDAIAEQFDILVMQKTLQVDFNSNGSYKDQSIIRFSGGNYLDVEVVSVTLSPAVVDATLTLEAGMEVERYFVFDVSETPVILNDNQFVISRGELEVNWNPILSAEEYDLEWTYINNYDTDGTELSPAQISIEPNLFKYSSTRISTKDTTYRIPLIYERGYIAYRVRVVSKNPASDFQDNIYGMWSYDDQCTNLSCLTDKYLFSGHETGLNWQVSTSFAEQGKNKVAVSYFDGSLRNRQVVSRLNTEDLTIVGETIYDHQGRGAIQVLPVPTTESRVKYYNNFNQNVSGTVYSRVNFDLDENCLVLADPMSTFSGASNYYSLDNLSQSGKQAFLPDAQKYPFTQIQYTSDNTGRIHAQTGVGIDHQLGSAHETKYFYGVPEQFELDRLFGSDVGMAARYKKNMVQDANGQLSVSYLDPQGRVIATALAGRAPDQLDSLAGGIFLPVSADLLGKVRSSDRTGIANILNLAERSLTLNKQLTVTSQGTRTFDYKLTSDKYSEICNLLGVDAEYCFNSVLDLSISLIDDCGVSYLLGAESVKVGEIDLSCATSENIFEMSAWQTTASLDPGTYTLSKKLTINEEALDFYTAEYLSSNDCFIDFQHFLNDELAEIDTLSCEMTCEVCRETVGVYQSWSVNPYNVSFNFNCDPCLKESEYNGLIAECDDFCEDKSIDCRIALEGMVADMSPMGQYAGFLKQAFDPENASLEPVIETTIAPEEYPLSVFNEDNFLPVKSDINTIYNSNGGGNYKPNWRYPYHQSDGGVVTLLYLENDRLTPSLIDIFPTDTGTFVPAIKDGAEIELANGSFVAYPHNLARLEDFIINWKESWGWSLVRYHPEYGYYDFCIQNNASNDFDNIWNSTNTYQDAVINGFIDQASNKPNPLGANSPDAIDPYFNSNTTINPFFDQNVYDLMKGAMTTYATSSDATAYSIWEIVNININCPYATIENSCSITGCVEEAIDTDDEWNVFKAYYISIKQKFQEARSHQYAIANTVYNGCIGEEDFNPFANGFYRSGFVLGSQYGWRSHFLFFRSQYFNYEQPCNWATQRLYGDKFKRFNLYGGEAGSLIENYEEEECYDESKAIELDGKQVIIDCPARNAALIVEMENEGDRILYETCGQCPLARDLQVILDAIAARNELSSTIPLSCYPESNYPQFVTDLESEIPGAGGTSWMPISSTVDRLDANFTRLGGDCSLTLIMPSGTGFSISDIRGFCCLQYETSPVSLPFTQGYNFTITGIIPDSNSPYGETKVVLEGVSSCINVGECSIAPRCTVSETATDLQTLFNALIFGDETGSEFTASNILLNDVPYDGVVKDLYELPEDSTLSASWVWNAAAGGYPMFSGNMMESLLTTESGSCIVDLTLPVGVTYTFNDILVFSSIKPDPDESKHNPNGSTNYFLIKALVPDGLFKRYIELSGYSPCFSFGECLVPTTQVINQ